MRIQFPADNMARVSLLNLFFHHEQNVLFRAARLSRIGKQRAALLISRNSQAQTLFRSPQWFWAEQWCE
jgi:hypothetical protein